MEIKFEIEISKWYLHLQNSKVFFLLLYVVLKVAQREGVPKEVPDARLCKHVLPRSACVVRISKKRNDIPDHASPAGIGRKQALSWVRGTTTLTNERREAFPVAYPDKAAKRLLEVLLAFFLALRSEAVASVEQANCVQSFLAKFDLRRKHRGELESGIYSAQG